MGSHEEVQGGEDRRGILQVGEVASVGDELEAGTWDRSGVGATVVGVYHTVRGAPDDDGRGVDSAEATEQRWVVHVRVADEGRESRRIALSNRDALGGRSGQLQIRRVVEAVDGKLRRGHPADVADRVTFDLDAGCVDEDDSGDAVGRGSEGELGSKPSAHRGTDDEDVLEVLLDQVLGVEVGERADAVDVGRALRALETRVRGSDDVGGLSEVLGEESGGEGSAASVQEEDGAAGSGFLNLKHKWNCISTCLYTQADTLR